MTTTAPPAAPLGHGTTAPDSVAHPATRRTDHGRHPAMRRTDDRRGTDRAPDSGTRRTDDSRGTGRIPSRPATRHTDDRRGTGRPATRRTDNRRGTDRARRPRTRRTEDRRGAGRPSRRHASDSTDTRQAAGHRGTRLPRGLRAAVLGAGAGAAAVTASLLAAPHVPDNTVVHDVALVVHLVALALGMGAVLLIDLTGARWALGRVGLGDVARLASLAHPAVWLGLAGLALTGALLDPDPASTLTRVKLAAVVLVCANGGYATALSSRVSEAVDSGEQLPRAVLARALVAGALSQAGWWTSVVIGVVNAGS